MSTKKENQSKEWDVKRILATIFTIVFSIAILGICMSIVKTWQADSEEKAKKDKAVLEGNDVSNDTTSVSINKESEVVFKTLITKNKSIKSGFSAQGRLRAYDKIDVVAEVQGMMLATSKPFKIGTRYEKDELMFEMDNTEARLALKSQKAQLRSTITAMMPDFKVDMPSGFAHWKSYLDRFDVSQPIKAFPKAASDREKYYVSTKGLETQYYNIKSAEVRLNKYQVKAAFDGVLTSATINEGSFVRAGAPLGTLMNSSQYELEASVQVADLKSIRKGSSVKVVSDDSGKTWNGTVKRIGDMVDPGTQTATVYISLNGKGLREGQYLRAIINTSAISQATEVPRSWLVDNDKLYALEEGSLKLLPIQIVKIDGDNVIVKGLPDGTALLAEKVKGAYDGMIINQ